MKRTSTRTSGDRIGMSMSRAVIDKVNDQPFMQTMGLKIMGGEQSSDVEHFHPFGFTAYPKGATSDEDAKGGAMKGAAEVILMSMMGNRSHPIGMPAADRRHRPNGLKEGETVFHDAHKQFLHMGKDLMLTESPKKIVHRVAAEKSSSGSGSGASSSSQGGQQQKNNGANVADEKDVKVSAEMDADGSYTVTATKIVLKAGGCTITMADGKIILDGEVHLGGGGGQQVHRKGDTDSDGDTAVGSASKVYAV